jgi:hypothetical protein
VAYVMRVWTPEEIAGQFLVAFDFEAENGKGWGLFTHCLWCAKRFPTATSAMQFFRRQSKSKPYRPDGQPNRPLTASTVEIVQEDEV